MRSQSIERVNGCFGGRATRLVHGALASAAARRAHPRLPNRRSVILGLLGSFAAACELQAHPVPPADLLRIRESDRVMGEPGAPIVIVEYASFTCASCARFHNEVLPAVKAKLVFRHFPFDNVATRVSQLAECSTSADFFPTVAMLFRSQDRWLRVADPVGDAVKLLAGLGVTRQSAEACAANLPLLDKVIDDVQSGQTLEVTSTPTLFINGENHHNPGNSNAIEAILSKAAR